MDRNPHASNRKRIQAGEEIGWRSQTILAEYRGQSLESRISTSTSRFRLESLAWRLEGGRLSLPPVRAASSRARPRTPRQSPRLGVTATSRIQSFSPKQEDTDWPKGASSGKVMMPSWSWDKPSSLSEQSIPSEASPLITVAFTIVPEGSAVPALARGDFIPTRTLEAPQTTVIFSSLVPTVTRKRRSARGWGRTSVTRPTTTPGTRPKGLRDSTSRPAMVRALATACGPSSPLPVNPAGRSTSSFNQLKVNFISSERA